MISPVRVRNHIESKTDTEKVSVLLWSWWPDFKNLSDAQRNSPQDCFSRFRQKSELFSICVLPKPVCFSPVRVRNIKQIKDTKWYPLFVGAGGRTRTGDLRITNALLYQLSHTSKLLNLQIKKQRSEILI